MLLGLSDDQEFFRQTTERFLSEQVPPDALRAQRDDPAGFDPAYWRRGVELGWTSLLVDEEHGGGTISGAGLEDLSLVAYEFGRHAAPGPLVSTNVVAAALNGSDTGPEVLGGLVSGQQVATWCAPVLGAGGWEPTVEAVRDGSGLVLHGEARPVESATQADHLLVTCRQDGGVTQVLVPVSSPGVRVTPLGTVDLSRRFGSVTFDAVSVQPDAVVGQAGEAAAQVEWQLRLALVLLSAESVGAMQSGFDITLEWAFDRYSFGRPLASYQALKHRFADMLTWLEASRAITGAACVATQQQTEKAAELTSAAKAYSGEYGAELLQDCVQLHGGIGVTFEHDLHLYLRRVIVDRATLGTPADHRRRIGALVAAKEGVAA